MNRSNHFEHNDDLAFYGKVNASISHELKNIMAIISETAGLMNDLLELASRGQDVDSETIMTCGKDIMEEIQRGFTTIKQMNRFSHSVDEMLKSVNIMEVLELTVGLAGFLSFACKVHIDLKKEGAVVFTCPFRLQNLIYQSLVFAFRSVGPHGEIHISLQSESNANARITFSGISSESLGKFPTAEISQMATSIDAKISANREVQAFDIQISQLTPT